jgi:ArsR family transcriptional regulator, arsenate/arsenite/antimonite-responsive transcriptional repressor / arsenate reductase (thioredoxin)
VARSVGTVGDVAAPRTSLARRAAVHHALGDERRLAIVDALRLSDRTPGELAQLAGVGSNLLAFHLDVLEAVGLIERTPSEGDARRRYVGLHLATLTELGPLPAVTADDVLFVCTHNAARSQLAAALWERATGRPARSAGQRPTGAVHPLAVATAQRHGIDLTAARPQGYDAIESAPDLVVSVCDRAREAGLPFSVPALHWSVPDPIEGGHEEFEAAYEQLATRIELLAACLAPAA